MLTHEEAAARVAKGAAYLDEVCPVWVEHVEVNTLDMADSCRCVLGQLHGYYRDACELLFATPRVLGLSWPGRMQAAFDAAAALGFDAPVSRVRAETATDFALLQDAWVELIAARRIPDPQPADPVGALVEV